MSLLSHLRLRTKLALLLGLSALGLVAAAGLGAVMLHERMIDDRVEKLHAITDFDPFRRAIAGIPGHRRAAHP